MPPVLVPGVLVRSVLVAVRSEILSVLLLLVVALKVLHPMPF